jgi:hypothetical protein
MQASETLEFVTELQAGARTMAVVAVQHVRRMRGGAQSHLMLGSDDELYVVKFQNNPQHVRVLANEFLATRIAEDLGLSVPPCDVVEVSAWLIANTSELRIVSGEGSQLCQAGLQFGSKFVGGLMPGQLMDYLPAGELQLVTNLAEFAGMLVLDKWTGNANGRQAVFQRRARQRKYKAAFIDHGYCFGAGEWAFRDSPLRGIYGRNAVYEGIRGWSDFEPWLRKAEDFAEAKLWAAAEAIPPEWYGHASDALEALIEELLARRCRVHGLIDEFRNSGRVPFPKWGHAIEEREQAQESFLEWPGTGTMVQ